MTCYAQILLIMPNFISLGQTIYEKSVTFYTLQYFSAPGGPLVPKFTSLCDDVQQVPMYQDAKFRPVL